MSAGEVETFPIAGRKKRIQNYITVTNYSQIKFFMIITNYELSFGLLEQVRFVVCSRNK